MKNPRANRKKVILFVAAMLLVSMACVTPAQASNVYVLTAGDDAANNRVREVLEGGGHTVTLGVRTASFDGTQEDLSAYDVVVILNNYSYVAEMPAGGKFALIKYLCGGGGIVAGEWVAYYGSHGGFSFFNFSLPVTAPTYSGTDNTTYTQETPDPVLNDGVTSSFRISLDSVSGTESSFVAAGGATVYYRSSMGGGTPNSPGVVGWTSLNGKVLSFSVLLTPSNFLSADFGRLFQNAVRWAAPPALGVTNTSSSQAADARAAKSSRECAVCSAWNSQ